MPNYSAKRTSVWRFTIDLVSIFPGYQYTPRYKHGVWDGQIHLFNLKTKQFPVGLLSDLIRLAKKNSWEIKVDKAFKLVDFDSPLEEFINTVLPQLTMEPYDYQLEVFLKSLRLNRSLVLSPTGSRKVVYNIPYHKIFT